jgi:hypothetical protein
MDITAVDFFASKYVMVHPDIMGVLDEDLVRRVKNLRTVLIVDNVEERRNMEALILWVRIPNATREIINDQFNVWIGNDINGANPNGGVEELKEEVKSHVKKYCVVEKDICEKKTRNLTKPIYISNRERKLMDFVSKNDIKNHTTYSIYNLAFELAVNSGVFNIVWDSIRIQDYGNKSEKPFSVIRRVFSKISYYNRSEFKNIFPVIMFTIHSVLLGAGIYNDYPTFSDYENLAAHIVLKGKNYCTSIVKDPQLVRPLLEYDEFHPIWDRYNNAL